MGLGLGFGVWVGPGKKKKKDSRFFLARRRRGFFLEILLFRKFAAGDWPAAGEEFFGFWVEYDSNPEYLQRDAGGKKLAAGAEIFGVFFGAKNSGFGPRRFRPPERRV